jgi:predicted DNA-binding transcriptional regulator AlpA
MSATAISTIPRRISVSDDDAFTLIGDLLEHFRCSRMWIERKLKDETLPFPKAVKLGGATSARRWRRSDVLAWELARAKLSERLS